MDSKNQNNQLPYDSASSSPKPAPKAGLERVFSEYIKDQQETATENRAKSFGLSYINLIGYPISNQTMQLIPEEIAQKYRVVAFMKAEGQLRVACQDPENEQMKIELAQVAKNLDLQIIYTLTSKNSLDYALKNYQFIPKLTTSEIKVSQAEEKDFAKEIKNLSDLKEKISQVPITKIFEIILTGAIKSKASDVHVEPGQNGMKMRYRIDGVLQDVVSLPTEVYRALLSRVKYLAKMKLDINNKPQNGRFSITALDVPIDLRVSTLPTIYGENVVMRLLEHGKGFLSLEQLDFSPEIKKMVAEAIKKPSGMILNTGPTGSGKTTTLYAILETLNKPGVKIITLEDPVEYRLPGINQTQVNVELGLDFASSLKSALRQDPDVLMVGEIRDLETAEIALQAAMTGHLVLSTLHTNNAPTAMPRLIDLGIKPFLLPGSVDLVMAQRLVRKICKKCKEEYKPTAEVMEKIKKALTRINPSPVKAGAETGTKIPSKLFRGRGCPVCNQTGYMGRTPIAEGLKPNAKIEKLVINRATISELYRTAVELGMVTMEQDGLRKALAGVTTIEEVWRVTASET